MIIQTSHANSPDWKDLQVHSILHEQLLPLEEIVHNLWWTWNEEARILFQKLDPVFWDSGDKNPVELLQSLTNERCEEIINDKALMSDLQAVYDKFSKYMSEKPNSDRPSVAYFSMEYGMSHVLKIYSGGLGVLAGDYMKEASDSNVDMTAVGFLYRYGYFTQWLALDGQQEAKYEAQNFGGLPITMVKNDDGTPFVHEVEFPGRNVKTHIWEVAVGRIKLYLMDTDVESNSDEDRSITHSLYGGDWENRMKQEYLLGIGGMQLLEKLGIEKEVYHMNEGHAALMSAERLNYYINKKGLSFNQAKEVVRSSSLYTVHTPVPAGHDYFEEDMISRYMGGFVNKLGISWQQFMDMGRENPGSHERFSMSVFALNTAQEANGVSLLHGKVSRKMFQPVWKGYFPKELHVGHVTNGVHLPTWASSTAKTVYSNYFKDTFLKDQSNLDVWSKVHDIPDEEIWKMRMVLKERLIEYIHTEFKEGWLKNQADPRRLMTVIDGVNPEALIIGFGRRFATYKRAHLLFSDLDRLDKIVNNPDRPVQFIFTGKAHPADGGGQGLIKQIIEISRRPEFLGKIIFLENYDMRLAKRLISGVDVWLNTPTRPLEASGTSGMKAAMNGVLNLSVLDGWWYEGYREGAGWALSDEKFYQDQEFQDAFDASTIYSFIEDEIAPLYFDQDEDGCSHGWVKFVKKSLAEIAPIYTTKRMMDDYFSKFYNVLAERAKFISENEYAKAKEIVAWKEDMASNWDKFEVVKVDYNCGQHVDLEGQSNALCGEVVIDKKDMQGDLGVEFVVVQHDSSTNDVKFLDSYEFDLIKQEGSKLYFEIHSTLEYPGIHQYALRVFPKNVDIPHRMDFAYVRWIS
ncbi:MAG: glycosyltransferase family 1 protein [Bacteroidales bacterium]|nr:glycosyltransferase family 1 protein [Bacteroidales bacterium]